MIEMTVIELDARTSHETALVRKDNSVWIAIAPQWWDLATWLWWWLCPMSKKAWVAMRLAWDIAHQPCVMTKTILCWGSHELVTRERVWAVAPLLPRPFECFGTTKDGQPRHTCRLPYATPIERWKGI